MSGATPTWLARAHLQTYRELLTRFLNEAGAVDPGGIARQLLVLIEGATVISAIDGDPSVGTDARALAEAVLASASGLRRPSRSSRS